MITQRYFLDIVHGNVPVIVPVSQYDSDFTLIFSLYASTGEFTLEEDTTATIRGTKGDGNGYSVDATIDIASAEVTVEGDEQLTAIAGKQLFELTLWKGQKHLSTANFILNVEKAPLDRDTVSSESKIRELYNVEDNADKIIAAGDSFDEWSAAMAVLQETTNEAINKATNAENEVAEANNSIGQLREADRAFELILSGKVDGGYADSQGYLILTANGEPVGDPIGPFAGGGGGGGGGGNKAVLTVANTTGWLSTTIASGGECYIKINWSSIEDEMPTGNGTLRITVNNIVRASFEVEQGEVTRDISPYLSTGSNVVKINIADVYGNNRTINFSVSVVELSISSTFDTTTPYTGVISFPYTPVGAVAKTIYFYLDGNLLGTQQTSVSNRQMTYSIPAQAHGAHSLRVYFEAEIQAQTVRSNELYFEFISVVSGNDTPIITSGFKVREAPQYTSLQIPFMVYTPNSLTSEVTLKANNQAVSQQTVDRTEQVFTYRADSYGTLTFQIVSGGVTKALTVNITESSIDVEPVTEDLELYLSSAGRSNSEANPGTWEYNDISAEFAGFNFKSDGWQKDADGITALRVSGGARLTIPFQPFATDFRGTGKTLEIEFATRNVLDYDATIVSCNSEGRGLNITAQRASLKSEQSEISTQYKEDEHVRLSFVVEKRSENRLLMVYINGVASGVIQYPDNDDFSQVTPVNISIGSDSCTTDLYCIRIYSNNLSRYQILDNWIADTQVGADMLDRYTHNNIYDSYGNVVISKLPSDLPYLILECPELPQYKGDKKTVKGSFVNPLYPSKSFTFEGAQANVQGTSSQYYPRKNYKIKFKGGFVMQSGSTTKTYAINNDAVPTNTFTFKADVASSEGANNVELARLYNDACPYKTPPQTENPKVRQGIDGFPIVVFWNNGVTTSFVGKYNFNNDKGTEEVFGFVTGDESWEIKNNTSSRVLWKSADYSGTDWLNDFEARYPDTDPAYTNAMQLSEFAAWAMSTDTTAATGDELPSPVTYGEGDDAITYTNDTAEYRLAKFKYEAGNYMEMQSALFYYLFTELFLMVDSRAKNAFPSFMGGTVNE